MEGMGDILVISLLAETSKNDTKGQINSRAEVDSFNSFWDSYNLVKVDRQTDRMTTDSLRGFITPIPGLKLYSLVLIRIKPNSVQNINIVIWKNYKILSPDFWRG